MAIAETLGRMVATLVAIIRTRVELAVVEMEQESLRLLSYLVLSLLALLCFSIAILLGTFFVIVLFWDTHRIASILITAGVYLAIGLGIGIGMRSSIRHKPRLLSYTIAELSKDVDSMKNLTSAR